jgi:hypothetical protein
MTYAGSVLPEQTEGGLSQIYNFLAGVLSLAALHLEVVPVTIHSPDARCLKLGFSAPVA